MGITIKDIARKANVAVSTVSRALNNKTDINPKTREKILKIMDECGYNPNSVARGLVMQKLFTLGLIIPDISNPFFAEIAVGIEKKAKELGYSVIFCNTNNEYRTEIESVRLMKGKMVDGLIVSLSEDCKNEIEVLNRINIPVVQIDRKIPGVNSPGIYINNKTSAYNATKYLIELGHRKIAHFTGNLKTQTGIDRLEGFRLAAREANIADNDIYIEEGKYNIDSGKESMRKLIRCNNLPTALFAASDLQAVGALYVANKSGIDVPDELAIVGHDDIDLSYLVHPNITTFEQPKKEIGQLAVEMILEEINNKNQDRKRVCEDIILDTKLVIRESTKVRE